MDIWKCSFTFERTVEAETEEEAKDRLLGNLYVYAMDVHLAEPGSSKREDALKKVRVERVIPYRGP